MAPRGRALARLSRDSIWLGAALAVGLLATLAFVLWQNQASATKLQESRFAQRAELTAALTESVFTALGEASDEQLVHRYGGDRAELERTISRELRGSRGLGYVAVVDSRGRTLAAAGKAPPRLELTAAPHGGPQLSDVVRVGKRAFVEYAVPFGPPEARRAVIQGVRLEILTAFLDDYLGRVSSVDGAGLLVTDRNGVALSRRGRVSAGADGERLAATARVPRTQWHLRLVNDRARVLAAVNRQRWLPWLLLAGLALAGAAGMRLHLRLRTAARGQREANAALNESRDQLGNLVDALDEAVILHHADGRTELLNESARALVDTEAADMEALSDGWLLLDADGVPVEEGQSPIEHVLASGEATRELVGLRRPDGSCKWLMVRGRPLVRPAETRPYAVVATCTDVTEQRELELHLTELAHIDPLTGLWNRRRFEEDLAREIARCRRYDERAALLVLDIDRFKAVNDTHGHLAGDDVLRALGDAMRQRLRASDSAGRLGGDEFAVLMLGVGAEEANEMAADIQTRVTEFAADQLGAGAQVSVSVGMAVVDRDTPSVIEALASADRAMYADKRRSQLTQSASAETVPALTDRELSGLTSLRALLTAVQARDSYTAGHSRQVVRLARAVARRLGLGPDQIAEVESTALLHDLGKIAMPDAILRKPGALTDHEHMVMRQHPIVGAQMAASIPELEYLAPALRAEHERWDGRGYPDGLAAEQIPVASRITFVCDAYHAMTSDRPYRRALSHEAAMLEVQTEAGRQFCPQAARELLEVLRAEGMGGGDAVEERRRQSHAPA